MLIRNGKRSHYEFLPNKEIFFSETHENVGQNLRLQDFSEYLHWNLINILTLSFKIRKFRKVFETAGGDEIQKNCQVLFQDSYIS